MFGRTLLRCQRWEPKRDVVLITQLHCVDGVPVSIGRAAVARGQLIPGWSELAKQMKSRAWMRGMA